MYNLVGFQTTLKWGEQARVFRMIPGLEQRGVPALRGDPPQHLHQRADAAAAHLPGEGRRRALLRGADHRRRGLRRVGGPGLLAGLSAYFRARGEEPRPFPEDTAHGALGRYIARSDPKHYQPTNIAFGLLPDLPHRVRDKAQKRLAMSRRALESLERFHQALDASGACPDEPFAPGRAVAGA